MGRKSTSGVPAVALQLGAKFAGMLRNWGGGEEALKNIDQYPELRRDFFNFLNSVKEKSELAASLNKRGPRFTVTVGRYKKAENLIADLDAAGVKIADLVRNDLLGSIKLSDEEVELSSHCIIPRHLGYQTGYTRRDAIYRQAIDFGLDLLPQEYAALVALQLGQQLKATGTCDLELGERHIIASRPITSSDNYWLLLFIQRNEEGVWLAWCSGDPAEVHYPDDRFLFRRKQ